MANQTITKSPNSDYSNRIRTLRTTIKSLLHEASLQTEPLDIDPEKGIDFYENVARFETRLIELALEMSGGRQNRAAKLLRMRATTLNWKIKKLAIKA